LKFVWGKKVDLSFRRMPKSSFLLVTKTMNLDAVPGSRPGQAFIGMTDSYLIDSGAAILLGGGADA